MSNTLKTRPVRVIENDPEATIKTIDVGPDVPNEKVVITSGMNSKRGRAKHLRKAAAGRIRRNTRNALSKVRTGGIDIADIVDVLPIPDTKRHIGWRHEQKAKKVKEAK